eukprot:scaffold1143_cov396-Pavlova_lutheri.AAC.4
MGPGDGTDASKTHARKNLAFGVSSIPDLNLTILFYIETEGLSQVHQPVLSPLAPRASATRARIGSQTHVRLCRGRRPWEASSRELPRYVREPGYSSDQAESNGPQGGQHALASQLSIEEQTVRTEAAVCFRTRRVSMLRELLFLLLGAVGSALLLTYAYFRRNVRWRKTEVQRVFRELDAKSLKRILQQELPSWVNFPDYEKTIWINTILERLWPYIDASASTKVDEIVGPLMEKNKPKFLKDLRLDKFTLGTTAPQLNGIKVYPGTGPGTLAEELVIDINFAWASSMDIIMAIVLYPFLKVKVGVDDLVVSGSVRIKLKPLLEKIPVVGAISVSLIQKPRIDFGLKVLGGEITAIPGLDTWFFYFITEILAAQIVLPEKILVPLIEGDLSQLDKPQGLLLVELIEARNLKDADMFGKTDSYVKLYVRKKKRVVFSQMVENNLNPKYNERHMFIIHDLLQQQLFLDVYDHDRFAPDDIIGRTSLKIQDIASAPEGCDLWLELKEPSRKNRFIRAPTMKKKKTKVEEPQMIHVCLDYISLNESDVSAMDEGKVVERSGSATIRSSKKQEALEEFLSGGMLSVKIVKATNLQTSKIFKSQVTVNVRVYVKDVRKDTKEIKGNLLNPEFNEELEFFLYHVLDRKPGEPDLMVEFEVKGRTRLGGRGSFLKEILGRAQIPLKDVIEQKYISTTFDLLDCSAGSLQVQLSWFGALQG